MSPTTDPAQRRYQFFILSLWLETDGWTGRPAAWRISLEDPRTAQRNGFTSLTGLNAFLTAWMEERANREQ